MGDFTYEHLFDVLRRERSREEIQELEEGFYKQANDFISQQEAALKEADALSSSTDSLRTQLQNSKKLLRELYDRREKKLLLLALNKVRTNSSIIDTSSVLEEEQPLLDDLLSALKQSRKNVMPHAPAPRTVARKKTPKKPAADSNKKPVAKQTKKTPSSEQVAAQMRIKVTASVPKFMGTNSKTYGPYDAGKEVALPKRIANILIKKGRAEPA